MKKNFRLIHLLFFALLFSLNTSYGQNDTQKVMLLPQPIQHNSGFDVIIKTDGEIVYGIVKEVGLHLITYQRTDIPDGPIYTILRSEIYAISYRNQVKEYFNTLIATPSINEVSPVPAVNYIPHDPFFKQGIIRLGLGFIKSFTKVDNSKNYSSSSSFPAIIIGYDVDFKNQVRLGLQIGFGSRNFSKQDYSSYDSVQNNITMKENLFSLFVYAKYILLQNTSRMKPYIIGGLGINSSRISSKNTISFTNNYNQSILVSSGTRSAGLGVIARFGSEYYLTDQFQLYLDAGIGISIINAGLAFNLK
ncbi:MAG: outer membrane beta-barrel protein [Ferruginibacter sp.]